LLPGRLATPVSLGEEGRGKTRRTGEGTGGSGGPARRTYRDCRFLQKVPALHLLFCPTVDVRHKTGAKGHSSLTSGQQKPLASRGKKFLSCWSESTNDHI